MHLPRLLAAATAMVCLLAPARASADWLFTPQVGFVFGGNADFGEFDDFDDEFERRVAFGASLGWMGEGIAGFELDFGWAPNFFEDTRGPGDFEFGDSNVTTLMGNLLIGIPIGGEEGPGLRPYVAGGAGLMRTHIDGGDLFENLDTNDFAVNVGGGVNGFFTDNVGLRVDVRYFRSLNEDEAEDFFDLGLAEFDFWRAMFGVTFRFGS
jgi:hypothetical protein